VAKEEVESERFREAFHPEDSERLRDERDAAISRGVPFEYERRVRRRDGQFRWLLIQYKPLLDERGGVIRWYATGTDIHDRKQAEERTRKENVALREEIDQFFMFDEIVGSAPALKSVLSSIVKVAPTDSTVLITGETGTGKELIARAIHKGSQRAGQAFISVNCAAIPSSLIAAELFGHEKGAFTGALQRRQGRFELAHSALFFSMKSVSFPWRPSLHCSECSRSANLNEWEAAAPFPRMFESSLLPTAIWRRRLLQEHFAPTYFTG
jgi:formate hydrogenlyase transcriptional activator